jgi:hypothetical protein
MQAKCFAYHLLTSLNVSAAPNYRPDRKLWPIPQPRDRLQVSRRACDPSWPFGIASRGLSS